MENYIIRYLPAIKAKLKEYDLEITSSRQKIIEALKNTVAPSFLLSVVDAYNKEKIK